MKNFILILLTALFFTNCNAQKKEENKMKTTEKINSTCNAQKKGENKMKTTEKIDLAYYQQKINKNCTESDGDCVDTYYIEPDGTQVSVYLGTESDYNVTKIRPKAFEEEVKNYHRNGILKNEGKFFYCSDIQIGIWREYDEQGNLIKETDYDKQFKDLCMKPNDVLNRLERDGYIDRKTGKGQEKLNPESDDDNDIVIVFQPSQKGKTIFDSREPAKWHINIYGHGMRIAHSFNAENCEYLGKHEKDMIE